MSFFGFDSALPERRDGPPHQQQQRGRFATDNDTAFALPGAGEEEDLAVYTWGEGMGGTLLEGGDELNDETFGNLGDLGQDFQFAPAAPAPSASKANKPRGPIASTQSRYKPRVAHDPFAVSEDDFYSSRSTKTAKPTTKAKASSKPVVSAPSNIRSSSVEHLWAQPSTTTSWGTAPSSTVKPNPLQAGTSSSHSGPPPPGQIKTLEEIEAEMAHVDLAAPPPTAPPSRPQVLSLEEIEQQMMEGGEPAPPPVPANLPQPPREATPTQHALAGSGYASQQALLDSMFPQLGSAPPPGQKTSSFPDTASSAPQMTTDQLARAQALHERITAKIQAMSRYNNCMGSSDKDFITRIQLSQLATADPYTSDFYAQVFSALRRRNIVQEPEGPGVVQVAPGFGFGVGGPAGNRFGKMGSATMTKLSTQVKKLVENRAQRNMGTAALQGALGKVTRGNATAPRPVLAVPTVKPEHRQGIQLNQQSGITRKALTRKQVLYALEELYDAVLDLEQTRREMPPPTAMEEVEVWNAKCQAKGEEIWRRLMVMEPLDVSNPHPFISLMNPIKGQRLFPRLLRHLSHQQALTLLTLLIATYPQLDVVARAPPPPVADASLLTKADRLDRARREAETDNFLHCIVPGMDMIIDRCSLGLVAGLLGIAAQRMEIWRVAATRPGVALFTALLSKAQSLIRSPAPDPSNPQQVQTPDAGEVDQWNKTFAFFLQTLLPHLPELFPSSVAQRAAFGPGAYLLGGNAKADDREGVEMDRREAEVWGFMAALAVNAPEEEQTNLVGALREKILHTVQAARNPATPPQRAELKLRNVNIFLNGLGLDAAMIE